MRERLAASDAPDRIFTVTLEAARAARAAGLVGRRRVLDSTFLYDAVATMDTVTLLRSGIRGLLRVADADLESRVHAALARDDDYASSGKPVCAWDDAEAGKELVYALATDGPAALAVLEGLELEVVVSQAGVLLATLLGQDLDCVEGVFRIARRVARDRVISTVDPEARHGHETLARGFDGYKGMWRSTRIRKIIAATTLTAGNTGDAEPASGLLTDDLATPDAAENGEVLEIPATENTPGDGGETGVEDDVATGDRVEDPDALAVYGDAAYGAGALLVELEAAGAQVMVKVQPPAGQGGCYPKDRFLIESVARTVACPAKITVPIRPAKGRRRHRSLRRRVCHLPEGGTQDRAPMRRKHGGRRAGVRGRAKVDADFSLLAAAVNIARVGVFGISRIMPSRPVGFPAPDDRWSDPPGPRRCPTDPTMLGNGKFREEHIGSDRLPNTKQMGLPGNRTPQTAIRHHSPRGRAP